MNSAAAPNRQPVTIVELEVPRCGLSFGVGACSAVGTPLCYQSFDTCLAKPDYDETAAIRWRFVKPGRQAPLFADLSDASRPASPGLPCLQSVTTSESRLNPGAVLDGKSPFGVTAKVTVRLMDIPWNDFFGDPYPDQRPGFVDGRPGPALGGFWALFAARNRVLTRIKLRIYDGYEGQALADMRHRVYDLDAVQGPDASGAVQLVGLDPLRKADGDEAKFPPPSDLQLAQDVSATDLAVSLIGNRADLDVSLGNGGARLLAIGDELLRYANYSVDSAGILTLSGVVRAQHGSMAQAHSAGERCQRAGHYDRLQAWRVVDDLLRNHTTMFADYLDLPAWDAEGERYIPTTILSRVLTEPQGVRDLVGQICQQTGVQFWWSEYDRKVRMLSLRVLGGTVRPLTDEAHIMDGARLQTDPDSRLTRLVIYYDLRNPLDDPDDRKNYRRSYTAVDSDTETRLASPVIKEIFAAWIDRRSIVARTAVFLLLRYARTPRVLTLMVDAKDRALTIGDVAAVTSDLVRDSQGQLAELNWQITAAKEDVAGHRYTLTLQEYDFRGRFGHYMADGAPSYGGASDEQRASGGFYADPDGLMSDGSEGYRYQ